MGPLALFPPARVLSMQLTETRNLEGGCCKHLSKRKTLGPITVQGSTTWSNSRWHLAENNGRQAFMSKLSWVVCLNQAKRIHGTNSSPVCSQSDSLKLVFQTNWCLGNGCITLKRGYNEKVSHDPADGGHYGAQGLCYDAAMSSGLPWLRIAAARRICARPPFDEVVIKEVGAPKAQPTYLE